MRDPQKSVPGVKVIYVIEDPEVPLHSGRVEGGKKVLRCWQMFVEGPTVQGSAKSPKCMQLYARCKDGVPDVGGIQSTWMYGVRDWPGICLGLRVSDAGSRPTLILSYL